MAASSRKLLQTNESPLEVHFRRLYTEICELLPPYGANVPASALLFLNEPPPAEVWGSSHDSMSARLCVVEYGSSGTQCHIGEDIFFWTVPQRNSPRQVNPMTCFSTKNNRRAGTTLPIRRTKGCLLVEHASTNSESLGVFSRWLRIAPRDIK